MDVDIITCPECGFKSDCLDDFDCIGACNDNLFCNQCGTEFDPTTGEIHRCSLSAEDASSNRERGVWCKGN